MSLLITMCSVDATRLHVPADPPTGAELRRGLTVEIEQTNGDSSLKEVGVVLSDECAHPDRIPVKFTSGAEGGVKCTGQAI